MLRIMLQAMSIIILAQSKLTKTIVSIVLPEGTAKVAALDLVSHLGRKDAHRDSCIFQPDMH